MSLTVRAFRPSDAKAVADVRRAVASFLVCTPQSVAWEAANAPAAQHFLILVAELNGRVVGAAKTGLVHDSTVPGQAVANPMVHPARRGHGAGRALLTAAEERLAALGATRILACAQEDGRSTAFADRNGYRRSRTSRYLRLDLARTPLPPLPDRLPPGVELCSAADFGADPYLLYVLDAEATSDEPGDVPSDAMSYEDWLAQTWEHPDIDLGLTTVVVVDGEPAAFSAVAADGLGRCSSAMTGAKRAFRGRGLAKLAKLRALHEARAAGCTEAFTGNDTTNAPMLAINNALGYTPYATEWRCLRELHGLSGTGPAEDIRNAD
ncbi:GNAT family N-acetyltransferase [Streptomyces purpurogeneiscleroticus]|uniref:GNAT family N-acetyltransferase n=1 Tax=Streptomyces purpurogeneiscleroticus TaxID=68259 RepID=UPI001CBC468A|nr:GNAT family N-acetyltransferase [Streptomyces purpurogeneiscleroticus]MBZ4014275.1 GNAT family N-acetyltransferase [Streptomyces purpurogeneiscleroticus]